MRLKLLIYNEANEKINCRISLRNLTCEDGGFVKNILEWVYCDGEFEFDLKPGMYRIEVCKGKLFWPFKDVIQLGNEDKLLKIQLKEILDTRGLNLYSFDAHSHVSRNEALDTGNLVSASAIMKGEDFNFFFAGSPYTPEVHLQYLNRNFTDKEPYREKFASDIKQVSNERYILDIGNEIIKCRYGHACLMNYEQKPPFSKYYDEEYDAWQFHKTGEEVRYSIGYMYEGLLRERGQNSVAFAAHPTSWWWSGNGQFITNIASTLGFEILAGSIDAMVIMGYGNDKKYYQDLWYDALNNGYFLPGIAETDAAFDTIPEEKDLAYKTYAITGEFSVDALCKAVREGRVFVTTGPVLLLRVNRQLPGSVLKHCMKDRFEVEIDAYRCYQAALSKIQIIVNGEVYREYFTNEDSLKIMETVRVDKDSYIVAKCYDQAGNVAIANPVYIRNAPFVNRGYLSDVTVNVKNGEQPACGVFWLDEDTERNPFRSSIRVKMRVASKLNIEVNGIVKTIKLFELDELQRIFKNLYLGRFNESKCYMPGEVPAKEFQLARIREILDKVELDLCFGN